MHVPIKVDYAVRALVDLAQRADSGPVHAAAVAQRQGIPEAYLERLLSTLNKQGLVSSQRGPQGGHVLGRDPAGIDLRSVMEALGDTVSTVSCIEEPDFCAHSGACGTARHLARRGDRGERNPRQDVDCRPRRAHRRRRVDPRAGFSSARAGQTANLNGNRGSECQPSTSSPAPI